jgi:hypothetical protein
MSKPWKNLERKSAKALGGTRAPCSGSYLPDKTDVEGVIFNDEEYCVSCKYRAKISIYSWWKEVKKDAKRTGKTPLLVIKQKGEPGELAVVPLEFLAELLKK